MNQGNRLRTIFIFICVLLISQIVWWIIYNNTQNEIILNQKKRDIALKEIIINTLPDSLIDDYSINKLGLIDKGSTFEIDPQYIQFLDQDTNRKNIMFTSESIFLMLLVITGIILVYRSLRHELNMAMQQQNFLLSITHELKTPISSVKLLLQTLTKKNIPQDKRDQFISESMNELERLNTLVTNIIHTTKAEASEKPFNVNKIALRTFIQSSFQKLFTQKEVQVKVDIDDHLMININEDDLYLICSNLISNALIYCEEPICKIDISATKKDGVTFIISDNGIGIDKNEREKIFDRFYRIGSEETRHNNGTGIGLYIVRLILKKYRATITCEHNEPNGSKFIINFSKEK